MREKSVPQMLLCTCGKMMEQGFLLHTVRPFVLEVVRLCEQENYDVRPNPFVFVLQCASRPI